MSILREQRAIRLNEVIEAATEAADHYEEEATRVGDDRIARLFANLARRRREMSETLSKHIRRLGDLPFEPDVEAELIHEMASKLRAMAEDSRLVLLEERIEAEAELQSRIGAALATDLPTDTLRLLEQYREDTITAQVQLKEMLTYFS
jgi:uncharacterized protein (TIGR02284 family)